MSINNERETRGTDSHHRMVRLLIANRTPEELAVGYLRYETVRKMSPRTFGELYKLNLSGKFFDSLVDEALQSWKQPNDRGEAPPPESAGAKTQKGNSDVLKNQLNRILEVINSGLSALTPAVGTARELSDCERETAKLGLNICKLTLQGLNAFQSILPASEPERYGPLTFSDWLRTLESCHRSLTLEARTDRDVQVYTAALRRWKEAGYPDPGGWPDASGFSGPLTSSYTREWMERWANARTEPPVPGSADSNAT